MAVGNTTFIALASTAISLVCGVLAAMLCLAAEPSLAGSLGTGIFITYLVHQTLLFIPLAEMIATSGCGEIRPRRSF